MGNIIMYATECLRTFDESPFNEVDSLILSWLSYLHYPDDCRENGDFRVKDMFRAEMFDSMAHHVWFRKKTLELLTAAAASPRFRDIRIIGFKQETDADKQFAAVTFELTPRVYYVAYRGTDATFAGWREDMRLALPEPIPSQQAAVAYLEKTAAVLDGSLLTGGHSKGGNLAVYAAAMCSREVQDRLIAVYSHDGPGFQSGFLGAEGFRRIRPLIHKTLPQSSFVGMVFEQECEYGIVGSDFISLAQHNPFFWRVENQRFCPADSLTFDAKLLYKSMNRWVDGLNDEDREKFIGEISNMIDKTDTADVMDFCSHWGQNAAVIAKTIFFLSADTKVFFIKMMYRFWASCCRSLPEVFGKKYLCAVAA